MSLFNRFSTYFSSEAHSAMDKMEDPVKMTEQGIRDLKKDLREAMEALAEVKSLELKNKKDAAQARKKADKYAADARALVQRGESGALPAEKADMLARKALAEKRKAAERADHLEQTHQQQEQQVEQIQGQVNKLKDTIQTYENELVTLRARAKSANSAKKINKQLARADESDTIAMLERMKRNVEKDENLAAAYGDMAQEPESVDSKIDRALAEGQSSETDDELAQLKAELKKG